MTQSSSIENYDSSIFSSMLFCLLIFFLKSEKASEKELKPETCIFLQCIFFGVNKPCRLL